MNRKVLPLPAFLILLSATGSNRNTVITKLATRTNGSHKATEPQMYRRLGYSVDTGDDGGAKGEGAARWYLKASSF